MVLKRLYRKKVEDKLNFTGTVFIEEDLTVAEAHKRQASVVCQNCGVTVNYFINLYYSIIQGYSSTGGPTFFSFRDYSRYSYNTLKINKGNTIFLKKVKNTNLLFRWTEKLNRKILEINFFVSLPNVWKHV